MLSVLFLQLVLLPDLSSTADLIDVSLPLQACQACSTRVMNELVIFAVTIALVHHAQ